MLQATAKDFGYTVYSRVEETIRDWLSEKLLQLFGQQWRDQIPRGVWDNTQTIRPQIAADCSVEDLLDVTYLSDLSEIVCYRDAYCQFFPDATLRQNEFQDLLIQLNSLRAKVAHVRRSFSFDDLNDLIKTAEILAPLFGTHAGNLDETLEAFRSDPTPKLVRVPPAFVVQNDIPIYEHLNNLPPADYDMEGGFIGRREDAKTVKKYIAGNLYRVVTISGAGGVGKTALAHYVCDSLLLLPRSRFPFDAVVWVSAKQEELTLTGIEKLAPKLQTYEDLVDEVLDLFNANANGGIEEKTTIFQDVLELCTKGILFVVDNLETIEDEQLISFIKEVPLPHRVLITSRLGLGEIEKRHPLRSLREKEAIALFRCVSREKQLHDLASRSDELIQPLVNRMARYPLVIKWVLGQVSLGRALESVVDSVTSAGADVPKFCFNKIFDTYLEPSDRLVLFALCTDDRPMTKAVLCNLATVSTNTLDTILQKLTVASLVIDTREPTERGELETRYELLSLTRQYLSAKLEQDTQIYVLLKNRAVVIQHMLRSARHARHSFRYSQMEFGAVTEDERIASTWALTAHQRYISGSYDDSIAMFRKAVEFAPKFAPIYRLWASVESTERHFDAASDLIKRATELAPRDPGMWLSRGQIEVKANRFADAVAHLQQALNLAREDEIILSSLADAERRAGQFENGEQHFVAALEIMDAKQAEPRQIAITNTSRADNLRRWAEEIKTGDKASAEQKLELALAAIDKAISLQMDDVTALATRRQIQLNLGHLRFATRGFLAAKSHYNAAICDHASTDRDKRVNETAAFIIADHSLRLGHRDEAKNFIGIAQQNATPQSKYQTQLPDLTLELNLGRTHGVVDFIAYNRGYGFVRVQDSKSIRLERDALCSVPSLPEFNSLRGRTVSFVLFHSPQGEEFAKRVLVLK